MKKRDGFCILNLTFACQESTKLQFLTLHETCLSFKFPFLKLDQLKQEDIERNEVWTLQGHGNVIFLFSLGVMSKQYIFSESFKAGLVLVHNVSCRCGLKSESVSGGDGGGEQK